MKIASMIFILITTGLALAGCATPRVPIPVVSYEAKTEKLDMTVGLVFDDVFLQQTYKTSQLLSTWVYPLGDVLPLMIAKSLKDQFVVADIVPESEASNYKIVIRPKLDDFYAQAPATTFSRTNTGIKITYDVAHQSSNFSVSGQGTNEVITEADNALFQSLSRQFDYKYQAAGDAGIAILHCLEELNDQLVGVLKNSQK